MKNKSFSVFAINVLLIFTGVFLFVGSHPSLIFSEGFFPFAFFIYVPLLFIVHNSSFKTVWLYGFVYGALSYGLYAFWLKNTYPAFLLVVMAGYGIIFALVFLCLKFVDFYFKKTDWVIQWLIIISFEYIKTLGFLGFSYGVTAYSQWKNIYFIQICDLIGIHGLNCFIIFFSVCLYSLIQKSIDKKLFIELSEKNIKKNEVTISQYLKKEKVFKQLSLKASLISLAAWAVAFVLIYVYGFISVRSFTSEKKITVAAIQNNENSWLDGIEVYTKNIYTAMRLTDEALEFNDSIDLVVWPETSVVPSIIYNYNTKKDERRYLIVSRLLDYINSKNAVFVVGNDHKVETKNYEKLDYNSALVFTPGVNVVPPTPEVYSKIKLVPFTETFPYQKLFPGIYQQLIKKGYFFWEPGNEYKVFKTNKLNFSTLICYEDTFPQIARRMFKAGSRCFVCMSNDSWGESVACQNQHLAIALFRSVENKIPSVRSTASGKTCIIDPYGRILKASSDFSESYVVGEIPVISTTKKATLYNLTGDLLIQLICVITTCLLIMKLITVIIDSIKNKN